MQFVEKYGKNVEEAIELALIELEAEIENVDVEVIEEEVKGLFGIFGTREAKIRVTLKENAQNIAKDFIERILNEIKINAQVISKFENDAVNIEIIGDDMGILIGKYGQTLDALQYLVSLVVNKKRDKHIRVTIDTENYREKRKEMLEKLAMKMARKAIDYRKDIILEPMNPYERRIVHSALQGNKQVSTKSEGDEPNRRVIIFLKR